MLFGFPGDSNNARLIHICTLYAKYVIYTHKIKSNNNFEFLDCLTYLKHVLMIEENICITERQEKSFALLMLFMSVYKFFKIYNSQKTYLGIVIWISSPPM